MILLLLMMIMIDNGIDYDADNVVDDNDDDDA